ncbi:DNA-directed RNA polymerase subunit alpha [Mesotoga sp. SC_3PWM13N19]|jgi:DNA-directed RNA polymerase subunit alpha|uniref:DNA-directed RNA polymerase subunit alpha n=1 Tax=unclassified Mesotoga TaxID=1184398 RepID=UPI000CB60A6C|nr:MULTISPECIES: DNA-directed RNA polymerase subunit alpha [unclassified Mesotoga]MDD3459805.1 DNA-directed RNA polymerase subunit alpha [Mesotoga sp.]PNQ05941.1 DNA-directed RNA polymerase subunit alpha [Mesotoga sp. SC_NapDC3]PXF35194.1 DNA-directed RNA polymerase subunit alpha [Mesotoga sp. SC_NapDC]RAM61363.1 DNA-directed RNA polymerase subunit alpha [Mesotoga sp. SC_3PWM13N19]
MLTSIMPKNLRIEEEREDQNSYFTRFILSPMERGYATTIGNSLRRVLLSSIPSMAITKLKIPGKYHEYDVIDGVKEDILEIILNFKKVQLKPALEFSDAVKLTLEKVGPGVITAGDIKTPTGVEVVNPSQYVATLNTDSVVYIELFAEIGRGFVPVSEMEIEHDVEMIYIDGIFSPVLKVNFQTENVRVGKRTDYDKLVLDVWTKKSITPSDALMRATDILMRHFEVVSSGLGQPTQGLTGSTIEPEEEETITEESEMSAEVSQADEQDSNSVAAKKIEELDLSVRSLNCLKRDKINRIGDLLDKSEADLLKIRNFGEKSMLEVVKKLRDKFNIVLKKE